MSKNLAGSPRNISKEVVRARGRIGGKLRHDPDADISEEKRALKVAVLADRFHKLVEEIAEENPYEEWADAVCASLPPMTDEQISAAARVISCIDKRTEGGA